jgi:hypothetical protein
MLLCLCVSNCLLSSVVNVLESRVDQNLFIRYMIGISEGRQVRESLRAVLAFMIAHDVPFDLLVRLEHFLPDYERRRLSCHVAEFLLLFSPMMQGDRRDTLRAVAAGKNNEAQRAMFIELLRNGSSDQADFSSVRSSSICVVPR